jgi:hypothetical protein
MTTKFKSAIRAGCYSWGAAVCAGSLLLMAQARAQNLFEADQESGDINEFTTNGVQSTFASGLDGPDGLAFNSAGVLFEADFQSGNIYEFTTNGVQSTFASGLSYPNGLAFNNAGVLFVADSGSGNIYEFTTNGAQSTFASGLNIPNGLAFNSAGVLFEADSGSGNIYEFTTNGAQSTFASGLDGPAGLAFNSAGVLFEADQYSGNIYDFTTNGVQTTFASGLTFPAGLAFNSAGILFEADFLTGNIYEFTTNGVQSNFASGLKFPLFIAFSMYSQSFPVFSALTASQSIAYGTPAITLAGKVSATGPVYPASGETITVTINGNAQTTTINDSTGDFSFNYNPSTLPASATPYTISYSYAGDASLIATNDTSTTLTVNPLAVVLSGTRPYDGTNDAAASILTISNDEDGTNLTLNGSATLAGSAAGLQNITGFTGLALGGSAATNYTLTNASGAVTVTTVPLSITAGAQNKTYGTALSLGTTNFAVGGGPLAGAEMVTGVTLSATPGGTGATDPVGIDTITPSAATGTGGFLAANYNITYNTNTLTVNPLAVVLSGTRPYDGTNDAAASILTISNDEDGANLTLSGTATLAGSAIGLQNITGFTGLALGGSAAGNYTLSGAGGAVTITAAGVLSITANAQSKTYGQTVAFGSGSTNFSSSGLQPGDTIGSVTLACSGGASNAPVTGSPYSITPSGATGGTFNPANYTTITYNSNTLTISPLAVVLTGTQAYNGTTNVTNSILTVANAVGSDDVNVTSVPGGASMAGADVGTNALVLPGTLVLSGTTASNYTLNGASGAVQVTALAVVLSGTRPYDGTATATNSILTVANAVGSDDVNAASGSVNLASASVGTQAITSPGTLVLGGTTGSNYTLAGVSGSVTITNPFNAFSITSASLDNTGTNFVVCWQSVPGVAYNVLTNNSLVSPHIWAVAGGPITATATTTCFTLPGGIAGNPSTFVAIKQLAVTPFNAFSITSASLDETGTNFVVCWQSVPGIMYTVMTNNSLTSPLTWAASGAPITATGTTTCYTLPGGIVGSPNIFVEIKATVPR